MLIAVDPAVERARFHSTLERVKCEFLGFQAFAFKCISCRYAVAPPHDGENEHDEHDGGRTVQQNAHVLPGTARGGGCTDEFSSPI